MNNQNTRGAEGASGPTPASKDWQIILLRQSQVSIWKVM